MMVISLHMAFVAYEVEVPWQGRSSPSSLLSLMFGCLAVNVLDIPWEIHLTGWRFWISGQNAYEFAIVSGDLILQVLVESAVMQLNIPVSILRLVRVVRFAHIVRPVHVFKEVGLRLHGLTSVLKDMGWAFDCFYQLHHVCIYFGTNSLQLESPA